MFWDVLNHLFWVSVKFGLFSSVVLLTGTWILLRVLCRQKRIEQGHRRSIAFFHPYCNAGGGGERVLWAGIKALQEIYPEAHYVVYTGDVSASPKEMLAKVDKNLKIKLAGGIEFVYLQKRSWVEAEHYPRFTLLGQSLGSLVLGWEALFKFNPHIFIDTMGYAFTLPLFKFIGRCRVASYVHYPTISTDMLALVSSGSESFNNDSAISRNVLLTYCKLFYYRLFAILYSWVGRVNDVVMVNSDWTKGHIDSLWRRPDLTFRVFPPCDVSEFDEFPLDGREIGTIVSIGQFRPEKNHELQIRSFSKFFLTMSPSDRTKLKLVLIGGCRDKGDEDRVEKLKCIAASLNLTDQVHFRTNIPFEDLKAAVSRASIAVHSMRDEHFGIGIVEGMAAGLITVAHNSGGPKINIIQNGVNGFLARSIDEYSEAFRNIFEMGNSPTALAIRSAARDQSKVFSMQEFKVMFVKCLIPLIE